MTDLVSVDRRQSRRLARALKVAFRIGDGCELVTALGRGGERDNLDALTHWVEGRLADPDPALAEAALPHLLSQLERELLRWQADSPWR
jgi:hypothetical protein